MRGANVRSIPVEPQIRWFLAAGTGIWIVGLMLLRSSALQQAPDLIHFAVTFDLCITVPALYYLLVVRTGTAPPLTIVPLFLVSVLATRIVIPAEYRTFASQLELLVIPAELLLVAVIATKVRSAVIASTGRDDIVYRIQEAAIHLAGDNRIARIASTEIAILYLGILGWRQKEPAARGVASSTSYRSEGWGSVVACIMILLVAEMIAVHLFIQQWSHSVAWFVTAIEVWGLLWILGDYQALRLRPLVVTDRNIEMRFGFRWSATISRTAVASVEMLPSADAEALREHPTYLRFSHIEEPNHLIRLTRPFVFEGLFGIRREVDLIGVRLDDESVLEVLQPAAECDSSER